MFSPGGRHILTASDDSKARLWNASAWLNLATLRHEGSVRSAVFSPDGRRILTVSADNSARLWDASGRRLAVFRHEGTVRSAVFSPDGRQILTATDDRTARMWPTYRSIDHLIAHALSFRLKPLTADERRRFFLN